MLLIVIGVITAIVTTMANNQKESPLFWGMFTFALCVVGMGMYGILGTLIAGLATLGLLHLKLACFGKAS